MGCNVVSGTNPLLTRSLIVHAMPWVVGEEGKRRGKGERKRERGKKGERKRGKKKGKGERKGGRGEKRRMMSVEMEEERIGLI